MHTLTHRLSLLAAFSLVIALAGCSKEEPVSIDEPALAFDTVVIDTATGDCAADSAARCARIHLSYPVVTAGVDNAIGDSVNAVITSIVAPGMTGEGAEPVRRAVNFFLSSFEQALEEFSDFNQGWEHNGTVAIQFANDRMVCLRADEFSYTGGAHPNSETRLVMLSLTNGLRLTIRDLLRGGWEQPIDSLAGTAFRNAHEIPESLTIAEAGFWGFEEGFVLPENIGVDSVGLVFYYNSYEVGPYSAGPTEFTIPFDQLRDLLDPSGPLAE